MPDNLPSADVEFIIQKILSTGKVQSTLKIGNTTSFLLNGNQPIHKRQVILREYKGEVNFNQATSKAILFSFMGDLLLWYEQNKNWKEGGYFK